MASKASVIGGVLGVVVLSTIGGTWLLWSNNDYSQGARDLPNQIRLAKAEGLALEPEDLKRKPPVAPALNAADAIRAIGEEVHSRSDVLKDLVAILARKPGWRKDLPKAEAALRFCTHLFELTAEAAKRPECDFDRDFRQGPALLFPEFADIRTAVKALTVRADIQTIHGQNAEAWRSLEQAAVLSRHSGGDPNLISALVECACDATVGVASQRVLIEQKGSPLAVDGMRRVIKAMGPVPDLHRGFNGEVVMNRVAIGWLRRTKDLKAMFGPDSEIPTRNPLAYTSTACDSYDARVIGAYRKLIAALPKEIDDWRAQATVLDQIAAREAPANKPSYLLNRLSLPVFNQALQATAVDAARRRLCLAGAEVYAYRNAHGQFPSALPNMGKVGVDLMDGKPLRYRSAGTSFVLYSVGRNMLDDGGQAYSTKHGVTEQLDDVFGTGTRG